VCSLPTKAAGLVGTDFMDKTDAIIDFEKGKMSLTDNSSEPKLFSVSPMRQTALSFPQDKEGHSPNPANRWHLKKTSTSNSNDNETASSQARSWLKSRRKYDYRAKIPAGCYRKFRHREGESLPSLICMEPAMVPIEVYPARVLTRVGSRSRLQLPSLQGHIVKHLATVFTSCSQTSATKR